MSDVTQLLDAIDRGDPHDAGQLLPLVYDELRRLAGRKLAREQPGQTLNATALVHEAYLRLVGAKSPPVAAGGVVGIAFANRNHFVAAAATAMRRILIDRARRKRRQIHGGDRQRQALAPDIAAAPESDEDLLALDAALIKLAELHLEKARLVELRYFAGQSGEQAAQIMGISPSTADRHWTFARAWLRREVRGNDPS